LLANERLDEAVDPGARISLGGAKQEVGLQRWIDGAKVETGKNAVVLQPGYDRCGRLRRGDNKLMKKVASGR